MNDAPPPSSTPTAPRRRLDVGRLLFWIILAIVLLGADLWLKSWSFANVAEEPIVLSPLPDELPKHEPTTIIPNVLALHLTLNQGAIFGIGQGQRWLFIIISLLALGIIGWMFYQTTASQWLMRIALIAILAGALGNLYDRIVYGAVRDMLYMFPDLLLPWGLTWPGGDPRVYPWIFNFADALLVCGIIAIMILTFFGPATPESPSSDPDAKTDA